MKFKKSRNTREEIREKMRLTRPPRLEGVVKEAMMQPVRKSKKMRAKPERSHKPQGFSQRERKDYQLASKRR